MPGPCALCGEADLGQQFLGPVPVLPHPGRPLRQQHVLGDGQRRQQVAGPEHEPDPETPQVGQPVLAQPDDLFAAEQHPRTRPRQSRRTLQDVLLPEPEGPVTAVKLPCVKDRSMSRRARIAKPPFPYERVTARSSIAGGPPHFSTPYGHATNP